MVASDYPVTFPFGATTPPYNATAPHRGDDHAMPVGTQVLVNGTCIGLSGGLKGAPGSGNSDGPHLHVGHFISGAAVNPEGNGFNLRAPVSVYDIGSDSTNGNYVRLVDGDGTIWVYLHLSEIRAVKGQKIGDDMTVDDALARRLYTLSTLMAQPGIAPDRQPTTKEITDAVGRDAVAFCDYLINTVPWGMNWNKVKHYDENSGDFTPYTGEELFIKVKKG